MVEISRVLVANRGECARRIADTVTRLEKAPIVVYSADDQNNLHVKEAKEARSGNTRIKFDIIVDLSYNNKRLKKF